MFRYLTAVALLVAPIAASADVVTVGAWTLTRNARECVLSASYDTGTVVSVYGESADKLMFTFQNKRWRSIKNRATYELEVEFDARGAWPTTALGMTDIDEDGPGFSFIRSTATNDDGDNFLVEFAISYVITISKDGKRVDRLSLKGTRDATIAMARCLRRFDSTTDPFRNIQPDGSANPRTEI